MPNSYSDHPNLSSAISHAINEMIGYLAFEVNSEDPDLFVNTMNDEGHRQTIDDAIRAAIATVAPRPQVTCRLRPSGWLEEVAVANGGLDQ